MGQYFGSTNCVIVPQRCILGLDGYVYIYKYSKHKTEQSPDLLDSFKHEVMNGLQLKN